MHIYARALEAAANTVFMGLATDLMHRDNFIEIHEKNCTPNLISSQTQRQVSSADTVTGWTIEVLELRSSLLTPVADLCWDLPSVLAIRYCMLYPRG